MSSVGLLFVGAVLFMNGLLFLSKADPKGVAVFNLFVGGLQTANLMKFFHGSFPQAASVMAGIYVVGMVLIWFGPETRGQPLPD